MKLTLKRSGIFKCHWAAFDGRCGINRQPIQEYRYECEVVTDDNLDDNDFVVDQLDVNRTMQELFYPGPHPARSCERIAITAVNTLQKFLFVHSPQLGVFRIRVGVSVVPPKGSKDTAMISAEWTR